ncbi:hypothetical protein [Streptomyces goshikiensis]|uniref:hypothetical protein n=1 Tax=Streptomyces goshikiensis TaxID=1942 RepID=UPI003648CE0C
MSGTHRTHLRALFAVPLTIGLLGAAALPAGAAASPGPRAAASLTCRGAGVDPAARVRHRAEIRTSPLRPPSSARASKHG